MATITLQSVKDCNFICSNGKDVLVSGRNLWLFRTDGIFIKKFKEIKHIAKAVFLPENTVLVDSLDDHSYHYISLENGDVLWTVPRKGRYGSAGNHFAVTPDGQTIYDLRHTSQFKLCINRICPQRKSYEQHTIHEGLRCTHDFFCDEDGILCVMQSHVILNEDSSCLSPNLSQNGILAIPVDAYGAHPYWKKQWISKTNGAKTPRGCDGKFILRDGFSVVDLKTMDEFPLITEDGVQYLPADNIAFLKYDPMTSFLTVAFMKEKQNIIIDCHSRKVISRYKRDDWSVGYQGCLINNTFWMGTTRGIVRRPFPNMD